MFSSFPAAWVLVALPFLSALLISQIQPLRQLAVTRHHVTWPLGVVGLLLLFAELIGALPSTIPVILLAGAVSGFSLFWPLRREEGGGAGEGGSREDPPSDRPPRDDGPPLAPLGQRWPDWERFDRLRSEWERRPSPPRRPTRNR
jgi:hypothetical protein